MSEFSQNGAVVTLHRLGPERASAIEAGLEQFARARPIALVLPCLYDELSRPALARIVDHLQQVRYLDRIVVSLGRVPPGGLAAAQAYFSALPQRVSIVCCDGPRVQSLYREMAAAGLPAGCEGKGRAFWIATAFVLAQGDCDVIAAHDCDITTYSPEMLARLCAPLAHPALEFEFAKGYYARLGNGAMHGRVTRLFVAPLIRAVQAVLGQSPLLTYLESFRYPLAGEFAMSSALARRTGVAADWGLEIGMLTEVYRQCALSAICQTELCDRYDHKHQQIGARSCEGGLLRMCVDISRSLLDTLADEGKTMTATGWRELVSAYRRIAVELVGRYHADAAVNGLAFAPAGEQALVSSFADALETACGRHAASAKRAPRLPSWNALTAALPEFGGWLSEAVELDRLSRHCEADLLYGTR